ncbi:MAG TPA: hypothetical protein DD387_00575 [Lachnoclostridium sp.]|nr:hypothetical protein [Lachnoclostridium sp.]
MKKHNMMRVASALAVVTLLSTSVISGTLAKYTSEATSQAESARVAKWAINAGSKNGTLQAISEAGSNSFTFDLFNTVKDTATGGGSETDISANDDTTIIAPGTWGYVDLVIENDSEVSAKYSIKLEKTSEDTVPLQYAMKKLDESAAAEDTVPTNITSDPKDPTKVEWTSTAANVKIDENDNRILNYKSSDTATGNKVTYRVYWKWDYGTNTTASENSDTSLGVTAATGTAATPTVKATVTATQVD